MRRVARSYRRYSMECLGAIDRANGQLMQKLIEEVDQSTIGLVCCAVSFGGLVLAGLGIFLSIIWNLVFLSFVVAGVFFTVCIAQNNYSLLSLGVLPMGSTTIRKDIRHF